MKVQLTSYMSRLIGAQCSPVDFAEFNVDQLYSRLGPFAGEETARKTVH